MSRGRALKDGLDYFSMDVHLDDKFQLLEAEHGLNGFAVIVKLYQKIYGGYGYYSQWNEEVALLFARSCGLGGNAVSEIVASAVRRGLFDGPLLNKYGILTSSGIQKRYFEATERRKSIKVIEEYLLLSVQSIPSNVNIISINADINSENANRNSQSKVKESKGKESKVKESNCEPDERPDFNTIEAYASSNLSYLSPKNMEELITFTEDFPDDVIRHAIDEACAYNVRTFGYVRGILNAYKRNGHKTLGDVLAAESAKKAQQQQPQHNGREIRWVK